MKEEKEEKIFKVFNKQIIQENCQNWTDDLFKPERKSLCPFNKWGWIIPDKGENKYLENWNEIKWARINKINRLPNFPKYDIFYNGATLDDIKQGGIGDCYFLSAIGSLTKFPNYIEKHFYLGEENKHAYGIYFL